MSLKYGLPFDYKRLNDNPDSCFSLEKQSSTGLNTAANAPCPPKESIKVVSNKLILISNNESNFSFSYSHKLLALNKKILLRWLTFHRKPNQVRRTLQHLHFPTRPARTVMTEKCQILHL